ncbi:hypothetical protein C1I92_01385 [Jiangella anatolica]|uniref:histidine kinase n=1 Tax=Jiangella anatolica TaxID=2670374 RepID=A0A2W2CE37_9ACTN|nr:hypothetical protein C1I92_01385 [Jiangella anatolica]
MERGPVWVALDVVVAYLSAVIAIGPSDHTASVLSGSAVERVCAVVWFAAIAGRRFAPASALWAAAAATVAAVASGAEVTNVSLATALAVTLVARTRPPRRAAELAALPVVATLVALAGDTDAVVLAGAVHAVAWLVGWAGRTRQEAADAMRVRENERAVAAERARVAAELHDAVGHAVTVMVTHAGAARLVLGEGAPPVQEALARIEDVGRGAMSDLDRILGLLTDSYDVEAALRALVAGLPGSVTAELRLPPADVLRRLPPRTAQTVGRVVQESLTNVVRHAGPAHAVVAVTVTGGDLTVSITDDGAGTTTRWPDSGRGLAGMKERVAGLGGSLDAGPADGGGWRVAATLPMEEAP